MIFWQTHINFNFLGGFVFHLGNQLATFREGSISNGRGTFEPKISPHSNLSPHFFGQKHPPGDRKLVKKIPIFVNWPIKPLGKICQTPPKSFFFSKLQELEPRNCVQPNFPILILILLNRFHKSPRTKGLNSSVFSIARTIQR